MYKWRGTRTVDECRAIFARTLADNNNGDGDAALLDAFGQCWDTYVARGRPALYALGDRAVVGPELAGGYGVADLVLGRTLVEVKLAVAPTTEHIHQWLRQLLGYVLLDRHNTFQIEAIALYAGWRGDLVTYPLPTLLATASGRRGTPDLARLRAEFTAAICEEFDEYEAWKERRLL